MLCRQSRRPLRRLLLNCGGRLSPASSSERSEHSLCQATRATTRPAHAFGIDHAAKLALDRFDDAVVSHSLMDKVVRNRRRSHLIDLIRVCATVLYHSLSVQCIRLRPWERSVRFATAASLGCTATIGMRIFGLFDICCAVALGLCVTATILRQHRDCELHFGTKGHGW